MKHIGFGLRLPISGPLASPEAIATVAREAERLGFDSVWVHDFIAWTKELDRAHVSSGAIDIIRDDSIPVLYESLTVLTHVAALTSRIRVGTSILCLPYREPIVTAKQIATLDVLSNGRLILGVGVGGTRRTHNQDFEILRVPRTEKYERTREFAGAMRAIWSEEHPSFDGRFVRFAPTELNPKPRQRPLPMWFGGKGDKSLGLAADLGQGWLPTWLAPAGYREHLPKLRALLEARGRTSEDFVVAKECYACIAPTDERAEEVSRPTVNTFTSGFTVTTYEAARAASLIGSPATIRSLVDQYLAEGVSYFEMKFIYRSIEELLDEMRLFAADVLPAYRKGNA